MTAIMRNLEKRSAAPTTKTKTHLRSPATLLGLLSVRQDLTMEDVLPCWKGSIVDYREITNISFHVLRLESHVTENRIGYTRSAFPPSIELLRCLGVFVEPTLGAP